MHLFFGDVLRLNISIWQKKCCASIFVFDRPFPHLPAYFLVAPFFSQLEESSTLRVYLLIEAIMFFELIKVEVSPDSSEGTLPLPPRNGHRKKWENGWFLLVF